MRLLPRFFVLAIAALASPVLLHCNGTADPSGGNEGTVALALSNVVVTSITSTTAVVTWSTNLTSTSTVQYGLTTSYSNATPLLGLTLTHVVTLTGLAPGTLYHYTVTSQDPPASTTTSSQDATFATLSLDGGSPAVDAGSPPVDSGTPDSGTPPTSLIHRWSFDEGSGSAAADSVSNASGTLAGGATWVTGADGPHAVAVGNSTFSGGGTVSLPANLPSVFTLTFWANASGYGATSDGFGAYNNALLGGETYLTNGFRSGFTPGGSFQFWTTQSGGSLTLADPTALHTGTWAQFAVTYSGGTASLYRDGTLVSTASGTYVAGTSSMGIDTGVGGVHPFWGAVDDVRIYDQVLSGSAIAALYPGGSSCTPLTACPAADNCGTISDGCTGTLNCGTCSGSQTCGGGGTSNVCGSAGTGGMDAGVSSNAFYVATDGVDSHAGTLAAPFATLTRCQTAMRGSSTKTCYVRAGHYAPPLSGCNGTCLLGLGSADNGETWSYYPPDGVDTADITGGSTSASNGATVLIDVGNTSNLTIDGLSLHNVIFAAIGSGGGTSNLTIKNNVLFNQYLQVGSGPQNAGGFMCYGCSNTTISHNVFHDIASFCLRNSQVNGTIDNFLVEGNVFYNTCTTIADCGAIYFQDTTAMATNIQIKNNFIRDGNTFAGLGSGYGSAIYPDDCTSNVVASGNVVTGRNGANTLMVHGGSNIQYLSNLIDLATYKQSAEVFQTSGVSGCSAATMSGNKAEGNVIISGGGGGGYGLLSGSPHNNPTISANDYHNYAGASISTGGHYSDSSPVSQDPGLSGWTYDIQAGSPILSAPVNFPGLTRGWGPPGYAIPEAGTPPSCSH